MRVLFAICGVVLPNMGYCQGVNYLATLFLEIAEQDEEQAFYLLLGFIITCNLSGMYEGKVYEYHIRNYGLVSLLKRFFTIER
mmetsp:Transcript_39526/g.60350  ORF Transcript_39526/g.60350 Transcript_39526/m.60350 type:complete len:83 (+) Transcript_39526:751-999(+)